MELAELIDIMRTHNLTKKPVLRITGGKYLEQDIMAELLDRCERLQKDYAACRTVLKLAKKDFDTLGSSSLTPEAAGIIDKDTQKWRYNEMLEHLLELGGNLDGKY